ncbi:hypothetical protein CTRI78_v004743 [Colletotrichum trifolii]|uniref:Uncharacterized protein n=1 Tax=Colletotrichum trifolii TaxID=5466 RepID=A0A4R8RG90_COLTR|nr:hypothetical protein CTRI78_v004743 [Colletotrichum trifolii]
MTPDDDSDDNNNNAVANTTVNAFEHITIRRCLQGYCHPILTHYIRKTVPIFPTHLHTTILDKGAGGELLRLHQPSMAPAQCQRP